MKTIILLALAAAFGLVQPLAAASPARLPNIVILYADDMGFGDLAIQNPESKIPTPHLDRLAREGTRFTDAHSSSGVCTPSRYALLTGRYHWRKFHAIVTSFEPPVIDPAELTMAEMLKQQGYRTACFGKWHLGWEWNAIKKPDAKPAPKIGYPPEAFDWTRRIPGGPVDHGFDYYFGDDVPNFPPYTWFENDRVLFAPDAPLTITPATAEGNWEARPGPMLAGWDFYRVIPRITEKALEWLAQQQGSREPFFLYVPFNSPHAPIVPTPEFVGKSQAGGYGDFMMQTDADIGKLLKAIDDIGARDNTIVIFTADNGAERYAYDRIRNHQHRSSGPLRGLKRDLWEGGHRMPFVVRWPGVVAAGAVSDAMTHQVDIMATLAAATGFKLPAGVAEDSYNLLPVWKDRAPSPRRSMVHNTQPDNYAVRHDQWVLIAARTGAVSRVPPWFDEENGYTAHDEPGELFDLSKDLGQRNNLYAKHPAKVAELQALLTQIRAKGQAR
jgi:arylsulfatase A